MINTYMLIRPDKTSFVIAAENKEQALTMAKNKD